MRKVKVVTLLIVAVLVGLSASIIYAASPTPTTQQKETFMKKIDAKRQEIYNDLGLTNEQRKLLEENKNKYREQTKALFAQMRQKMTLLRQKLEKSELNIQEIQQTNNELKQLQAQMLDNRLERILEVRKILTPEQFRKFEDKMNERMEYFKNKHERNKEEF
ncbi:MAG: periplasmic heavy metal sensor [Candidatus Omnitrophota bacterium]|jgi:Spy/CpxP family protein refolding chaperone